MKKLLTMLIALTVAFAAQATLLLYDGIDYGTTPDPQALGNQSFNGTSNNLGNVTLSRGGSSGADENGHLQSGSLSYSGLQASTGNSASFREASNGTDYNSTTSWDFDTQAESGSYFVSFLFRMNDVGDLTTSDPGGDNENEWIQFNTTRWEAGMRLNSNDTSAVDLAFGWGSNGAGNFTAGTSGLTTGTTHLVVMEMDFENDRAKMWVDPSSLGGSAPTADSDAGGPGSGRTFDQVTFATGVADAKGGDSDYTIDELRVGTTYADVTPVPEPATVGMLGLGTLLTLLFRRLRK